MKYFVVTSAVLAWTFLYVSPAAAATNVACVGDSITYGYSLNANETYPVGLQGLLGSSYVVKNFGQNGATMLKNGDNPYWKLALFTQSDMFGPNIVVIMLGTNDSKPGNWDHESEFEGDYTAMVQHYRDLGARVYIAIPPPAANNPQYWQIEKVIPHIRKVAANMGAPVIDVHAAFTGTPQYFADDVHPNAAGARVLANTVYNALLTDGGPGGSTRDATTDARGMIDAGGTTDAKGGAAGSNRPDASGAAGGPGGAGGGQGGSAAGADNGASGASVAGTARVPATSGVGGDSDTPAADGSGDSGCSCRVASASANRSEWAASALAILSVLILRRRATRATTWTGPPSR